MHSLAPTVRSWLLTSCAAAFVLACGADAETGAALQVPQSSPTLGTLRAALVRTSELSVSGDTFIRSGIPSLNEGTDARLSVQINSRHRSLLYFNAAQIRAAVGSGALVSASIELTLTRVDSNWGPGRNIGIHRMTHASTEDGATWACAIDSNTGNLQPNCSGDNVWNMGATDPALLPFAPSPTATALISNGASGVVAFDVTSDVAAILAGSVAAHGWLIKKVDEGSSATGALTFASRELGPAPKMVLQIDDAEPCTPTASTDGCNGTDDDCDGSVDEDFVASAITCGVGACVAAGESSCIDGVVINDCAPEPPSTPDDAQCDGIDTDCDGVVDEDYAPVVTSCGVGACSASGATSCVLGAVVDSCTPGEAAADDGSCDGVDQDCDGSADEDYAAVVTSCGVGACSASGATSCVLGAVVESCTPGTAAASDSVCDGIDEDCDGTSDEDFLPTCAGTSAVTCNGGVLSSNDCSDGNACNGEETCTGLASCQSGSPPLVDDGDPCTTDACDPESGVIHGFEPRGTACGTYDECDGSGLCVSWLPSDPADVAPVLDGASVALLDRVRFMFEGDAPIQTGVAPGVIQKRTAAVVHGRVFDAAGTPLPNVSVSVLNHPELGQTLSRLDGAYDLVVNGGGPLTLEFEQYGAPILMRTIDVPWQDYVAVADVGLRPRDAAATVLSFPSAVAQVHRGSTSADARGMRAATLYVPSSTRAELIFADGTSSTASSLTLRATELSSGPMSDNALPASLPATAAYAYAVELSADEAAAVGAETVELSQPASLYIDNFLGLAVGSSVPLAALEADSARWIGLEDAIVLSVLSENAGLAELDLDGSGAPADAFTLASWGITDEERERVADLYDPGVQLWRATTRQLAALDLSLPRSVDEGGATIPAAGPSLAPEASGDVLVRAVPVPGTPFTLSYRSDRVLGSKTGRTLMIPVTGDSIGSSLLETLVEIEVAGQLHAQTLGVGPSLAAQFTWNAGDSAGRTLHGWQSATIRVGMQFPGSYREPEAFDSSHAHTSASGALAGSAPSTVYYRQYRQALRSFDARRTGIGAWSLDRHHSYDPIGRVLYRGDGTTGAMDSASLIIDRFAGVVQTSSVGAHSGDGGPALEARMDSPRSLAVGPDGSVYIGTRRGVRRVDPDTQIMTTVAGGKDALNCDSVLEEGIATDLCIFARRLEFGSEGALYIADNPTNAGSVDRIRRLDLRTGWISHVAGAPDTTGCADNGDGGPATEAVLCNLISMAVAPDGSIYLLDRGPPSGPQVVRKISPNGIIETIGTGSWNSGDDNADVDVGPDGSVYITQSRTVSRLLPTGELRHFAGDPAASGSSGDGGPATVARFGNGGPAGVMVGPDGQVYIADNGNAQIRVVDQHGIIRRIAGTTPAAPSGNGGSPLLAALGIGVLRTALAPDGTLYLTTRANHTVRVIRPNRGGQFTEAVVIPSDVAGEMYHFDHDGRHLRTTEAATGALLLSFGYDSAGRLTSVTDASGSTTSIQRDANGAPTSIVSPSGDETLLDTDERGYLSGIFPPSSAPTELECDEEGLLVRVLDESGVQHLYSYDALGRLVAE